jgi:hypothetical protein
MGSRWVKLLFEMLVAVILFGCSYNSAYVPASVPAAQRNDHYYCSGFTSEYTTEQRRVCTRGD